MNESVVEQLRCALRSFPTGVTVITAEVDGRQYGLTISAFTSVSLDPPTVLFCVNQRAHTHEYLVQAERVGISILSGDQEAIALTFATAGADKFASVDWQRGAGGSPLIAGAAARLQARVVDRHSVGTHTVFIARVESVECENGDPLVYFQQRFVHGSLLAEPE